MTQRNERNPQSDRSPSSKNPTRRRDNANQGTEGGRQKPDTGPRPTERPNVGRRQDEPRPERPEKGGRGDSGEVDREPEIGEREQNDAADRVRQDQPVNERS